MEITFQNVVPLLNGSYKCKPHKGRSGNVGDHFLRKLITILKTQFEHFFCLHWFQVKWETPIFNLFTTGFYITQRVNISIKTLHVSNKIHFQQSN